MAWTSAYDAYQNDQKQQLANALAYMQMQQQQQQNQQQQQALTGLGNTQDLVAQQGGGQTTAPPNLPPALPGATPGSGAPQLNSPPQNGQPSLPPPIMPVQRQQLPPPAWAQMQPGQQPTAAGLASNPDIMKAAQSGGAPSVSAAQMGGSGQPQNADVAGQASIPPEAAQTLQQGLQGPLGPQYQQIIQLVKQANPNAPPAVRAMIVHDMMESVNAQSSAMVKMLQEQLKQQQEIERERHDVATEQNQGNRTIIYGENADTSRTREQDNATIQRLQAQLKQQQETERGRHDLATEQNQSDRTNIYQQNADTARTRAQDAAKALSIRTQLASLQEQLKQQQEIERGRHDLATEQNQSNRTTIYQENADTARQRTQDNAASLNARTRIALDKAGLGSKEDTEKVLNFASRNAQSKAEGNVSGRTQVARADAEAVLKGPASQAALAYLPPTQNKLAGYKQMALASFKNSPEYNGFKANNLVAAGEIARALAGGGLPRSGLTDEIASQLNNATDQNAWLATAAGYLSGANTAATATSGVVQQSGNEGQASSIAGSPPGKSQIPPPPPGFVVQ